ncbi:MAG TPA: hydrogenase maturation nickel metallochaperone HypA [Phycisphaerales bacterium]|nr:hydrogenase maturation nickel metallochaperone HypA [Phycisphaerales bacterium]
MHELSIATSLVSLVGDALESAGETGTVEAVRVKVGALSGVVVEALEFAWDAAAEGTCCEGARLDIERVPAVVRCGDCGAETTPGDPPFFVCGACGRPASEVISGRELDLIALELEQTQATADPAPEHRHAAPHP